MTWILQKYEKIQRALPLVDCFDVYVEWIDCFDVYVDWIGCFDLCVGNRCIYSSL